MSGIKENVALLGNISFILQVLLLSEYVHLHPGPVQNMPTLAVFKNRVRPGLVSF